jgi:hypothetical protein
MAPPRAGALRWAYGGGFVGKPLRSFAGSGHQDAQPPPSPRVGEEGRLTGVGFLASSCVPSSVSGFRTPQLPLLPLWEKGVGGMRGNGAPESRKSLISPKKSTLERGAGGSHRGRFFGKLLRAIFRFRLQDAPTPPSPLVGEGGWGDEGQRRTGKQKITHLAQEIYP